MRNRFSLPLAVAALLAIATTGRSDTAALQIQHQSTPCFTPEHYPRIDATIEPADAVREARVVFHAVAAPYWYTVDMHREGDGWTAALPRLMADVSRFGYFITARGRAEGATTSGPDLRGRLPEVSAFIVDVKEACPNGALPSSAQGPQMVGVSAGAPRAIAGFEVEGIQAFVENVEEDVPAVQQAAPPPILTLASLPSSRVRIATLPPPQEKSAWLQEDGQSVTLKAEPEGEPLTRTKAGETLEGNLESLDGEMLVLSVHGLGRVVVRQQDVIGLEFRQPGSPTMGVVGGLAGIAAGFLTSALACVTIHDLCHSASPLLIGTTAGMVIGAAGAGASHWKTVPLLGKRTVALALKPERAGAAVGLRVSF